MHPSSPGLVGCCHSLQPPKPQTRADPSILLDACLRAFRKATYLRARSNKLEEARVKSVRPSNQRPKCHTANCPLPLKPFESIDDQVKTRERVGQQVGAAAGGAAHVTARSRRRRRHRLRHAVARRLAVVTAWLRLPQRPPADDAITDHAFARGACRGGAPRGPRVGVRRNAAGRPRSSEAGREQRRQKQDDRRAGTRFLPCASLASSPHAARISPPYPPL